MSKGHCFAFLVVMLVAIVILFVSSIKVGDMFVYNHGDTYHCPDHESLAENNSTENFFSPHECVSLATDEEGYIYWHG